MREEHNVITKLKRYKGSGFGKAGGMHKHAKSGTPHNHANSIARTREFNRQAEEELKLKQKRQPTMFESVGDLFKSK